LARQLNDDFLERLALHLGENETVDAAELLRTLQPVTDISEYKRDLVQMKSGWVAGGAGTSGIVQIDAPDDRDLQMIFMAFFNATGSKLDIDISLVSRPQANPFSQIVVTAELFDQKQNIVVSNGGGGIGPDGNEEQRASFIRIPAGADLFMRIENSAGGAIGAGAVSWEFQGILLPPTRSWRGTNGFVSSTAPG